jgi:LCP family protein required for cell wall assembly
MADAVLLLFRLYAAADAVWMTRATRRDGNPGTGSSRSPLWKAVAAAAGLLVLLGFIAFPHVWLGYQYLYKSYDVLTTVFVRRTLDGDTSFSSGEPQSSAWAGDDQRLTILFTGCDAAYFRQGSRGDTNMVASFDLATGRIALFSIPRNTGNAPLSAAAQEVLGMRTWPKWLTELYNWAKDHPELAPAGCDPGAVTMRDTMSLILGIPIDYYAAVDMVGFVSLVDVLGGVDIYLEKPLHASSSPPTEGEPWLIYDFKAGLNHLDGRQALVFARTRIDSNDYVRMGRQRCVIAALIEQTSAKELLWCFPAIMDIVKKMVRTDVPLDSVQQLVRARSSLKTDEMITVAFQKHKYTNGTNHDPEQLGWILDYALIQSTVKDILEHPEEVLARSGDVGLDSGDCWKMPEDR